MKYLTIINVAVRTDEDGRFCLNDLHKAAVANGANARSKEPGEFLRARRTKELIALLRSGATHNPRSCGQQKPTTGIPRSCFIEPIVTIEGRDGGTYVVKELVYAYGQFVSPEFDLHVIRSYDKQVTDEINRLNGLQYRAIRAELEYQQGLREASYHGKGLRQWRNEKQIKLTLLEAFRQSMQPALFLN